MFALFSHSYHQNLCFSGPSEHESGRAIRSAEEWCQCVQVLRRKGKPTTKGLLDRRGWRWKEEGGGWHPEPFNEGRYEGGDDCLPRREQRRRVDRMEECSSSPSSLFRHHLDANQHQWSRLNHGGEFPLDSLHSCAGLPKTQPGLEDWGPQWEPDAGQHSDQPWWAWGGFIPIKCFRIFSCHLKISFPLIW